MASASNAALADLIEDLRAYLVYRHDEGDRTVALDPALVRALADAPAPPPGPAVAPARPSPPDAGGDLDRVAATVRACTTCALHATRTKAVPGQGSPHPDILFVGEAPGHDEDQQGLAFVGAAGQLLTRMIEAMGYTRDQVFIANILKCRPPQNRTPSPEETAACLPYLRVQIKLLAPRVIVTLGATAAKGLLGLSTGITRLRGQWLSFEEIDVMPTYHPAYLLRNPAAKREAWEDLQAVLKRLGRTPPPVGRRSP